MTIDRITLKALLEQGSGEDLRKEMIGFVAHRVMELEVEGLTGAAYGEQDAWANSAAHFAGDPNVWSGRASQEGSSSWLSGLAQMYRL